MISVTVVLCEKNIPLRKLFTTANIMKFKKQFKYKKNIKYKKIKKVVNINYQANLLTVTAGRRSMKCID